jgi:2-polyprenyl-3-methyl-5-hydroxy-6-metoxy-1,4-benzoquinol methylase
MKSDQISGFKWSSSQKTHAHQFLFPKLKYILDRHCTKLANKRCFDLGCGNGATATFLSDLGWEIVGVDPSIEGIQVANQLPGKMRLELGSAYDDLHDKYGLFPLIVSLEVIEHVYHPRTYIRTIDNLCDKNGFIIISTPYHGYIKNLVLSIMGKMDDHFTALWDNGHIKFWSIKSITKLISEVGWEIQGIYTVGRIPCLARSMLVIARKVK